MPIEISEGGQVFSFFSQSSVGNGNVPYRCLVRPHVHFPHSARPLPSLLQAISVRTIFGGSIRSGAIIAQINATVRYAAESVSFYRSKHHIEPCAISTDNHLLFPGFHSLITNCDSNRITVGYIHYRCRGLGTVVIPHEKNNILRPPTPIK